jgi:2C-methyl-D-erythritol 2,4-cyclodiphosphate synthase
MNNRKKVLKEVLKNIKKRGWDISTLKSTLEKYKHKNSKGKYRPYCEMIVYFLTKKLKQKGVTP